MYAKTFPLQSIPPIITFIMINCLQLQRLILPRLFFFDSLQLTARFQTLSIQITTIAFSLQQSRRERELALNIQLKIPISRSKFTLVLQLKIVNMRIPAVEIAVDLTGMHNKFQYIFQTEMGRVFAHANVLEQIYIPRQLSVQRVNSRSFLENHSNITQFQRKGEQNSQLLNVESEQEDQNRLSRNPSCQTNKDKEWKEHGTVSGSEQLQQNRARSMQNIKAQKLLNWADGDQKIKIQQEF